MSEERKISTAMFFGVRRGVGTTTLAFEIAVGLQQAGIKTLFVNLDPRDLAKTGLTNLAPLSTWLELVPSWLEDERVDADKLRRVVHSTETSVDVLLSPPTVSLQDAERIQSYRGRELARALFEAAQASGYGIVVVDGHALPISGFTDALLRRAGWVFFVAGKPELDAQTLLYQGTRISPLLPRVQMYALFRSPASIFTPWADLMAQAKLRTFFVPWVESHGDGDDWNTSPALQKAIVSIVREFLPNQRQRNWLPFLHN